MKPKNSLWIGCLAVSSMAAAGTAFAQTSAPVPTYNKDIAPIMQKNCQVCHRPDSIAPMSMLTYEETRPWVRSIKLRVSKREMPPWLVERNVGVHQNKFKNDRSLSDADVATIVAWADGGAPQGNPKDLPPPVTFTDANLWTIGEPDLIVSMSATHTVPAEAPNWWGDFVGDSGLKEDRYIRAVETKPGPGASRVVHHLLTYMLPPKTKGDGQAAETFQDEEGGGASLNEYALGKNGDIYPDGVGRFMQAGARIRFNLHYAAMGKETVDRSRVGLKFYPKGYVPKREIIVGQVGSESDLDFPPGDAEIRTDSYTQLTQPIQITGFQPHMHVRGKRQCLEAIYPNNQPETLICTRWDFGWHIVYNFQDDVAPLLPAGTTLHVISWHDNSPANKWNPDPRNWVGYGHRTTDDMGFTWLSYFKLTNEEYKDEIQKRKAVTTKATNDEGPR